MAETVIVTRCTNVRQYTNWEVPVEALVGLDPNSLDPDTGLEAFDQAVCDHGTERSTDYVELDERDLGYLLDEEAESVLTTG